MSKMVKFAVKSRSTTFFIFHALPNEVRNFQWFITEDKLQQGKPLENQINESITISDEQIFTEEYHGKYLYCGYVDAATSCYVKTDCVKLFSDINDMIDAGVQFDDIAETDKEGNIIA